MTWILMFQLIFGKQLQLKIIWGRYHVLKVPNYHSGSKVYQAVQENSKEVKYLGMYTKLYISAFSVLVII